MNLAPSVDVIPWYAGKIEIREYLKRINQESKVSHQINFRHLSHSPNHFPNETEPIFKILEYSLFQPGLFLDYLDRSPKSAEHNSTVPTLVDFDRGTAIATELTRDRPVAYTAVEDIAKVVVRAVDFEGEWPVVGGFRGNMLSVADLVGIGEAVRGGSFHHDEQVWQGLRLIVCCRQEIPGRCPRGQRPRRRCVEDG